MRVERCASYPVSIFIAGDVREAEMACLAYCDEVGMCVTVTPTNYVYTGGYQTGVVVGFINYPRFPKAWSAILDHAHELGNRLREALGQESYSIQTPEETIWKSWRPEDNPA